MTYKNFQNFITYKNFKISKFHNLQKFHDLQNFEISKLINGYKNLKIS